jgi:hypothetical protein
VLCQYSKLPSKLPFRNRFAGSFPHARAGSERITIGKQGAMRKNPDNGFERGIFLVPFTLRHPLLFSGSGWVRQEL